MAITVKHSKVSTVPDTADTSLVRPSDWNADHTLTGLGTMAEQDANNVNISGGSISGTTVSGYIPTSEKGAALGVATLDAGGKVPTSQIPLQGDLNYQGTWNASTNTPTLTSSTGTQGYYYVVDVAGTTNLNGITDWQVGDWAIFNGLVWQKVDNTDAVTSVNGLVGTVVLTTTNISEGTNEYFTQARARQSISAGTGISYDNSTGVVTNSAPDQVVSLTGAGTTTISGTYPNFTITSNDEFDGDVVGPASATDNAIARFDTTTGKLIQNSVVTVSDTGAIAGAESISNLDFAQFDTTVTPTEAVAKLQWDDGNGTLQFGLKGGNVNLQVGQEVVALCYNDSGVALTDGQIVYISGAQGNRVAVKLALATTDGTSAGTLGMVTEPIAIGGQGFVTILGTVNGLNTSSLTEGAIVYLSPTTAGAYTTTKPVAPQHTVTLGYVQRVHATVGSIYVKVDNGYELDELHNVLITSPTGGNLLAYDQTNSVWKNINLTDGTGISVTEATGGAVTITNTAPDQVVSISGGGTTTVTGTYPNFTVSSDDQYDGTVTSVDLSAGTGISVSGGPITTSGSITVTNTAPDQTVVLNAGTGISTSGTYPNFTVTNTAPDQTVSISAGTGISVSGTYPNFTVTNTSPDVPFTYTSTYVPYGQGTTTPDQSADFTYDESVKTLTAPQVNASNGIHVNSATISASYSIPSGSNAMSAGPVSIASGVTVTVPSGNAWVIV